MDDFVKRQLESTNDDSKNQGQGSKKLNLNIAARKVENETIYFRQES